MNNTENQQGQHEWSKTRPKMCIFALCFKIDIYEKDSIKRIAGVETTNKGETTGEY
jgi:hypothetical protein